MIGFFLPTRFVGFYVISSRLLDYLVEGVGRVGMVSNPSAAEMMAQNVSERIHQLSVIKNRYSLALFLPLSIFLAVYGPPLLSVWINPEIAANSSTVLLVLLVGATIAEAGQYNSRSILFGMGRHQFYSRALLAEALITLTAIALVLRPFGIVGAAFVVSIAMLLNRGALTAWLLSRELRVSYWRFLAEVYQPLLLAVPSIAVLYTLRYTILPGTNWAQLILAGLIGTACYLPLAFLLSLRPEHRELLIAKLRKRLSGTLARAA
jgi:O-antigen/teichoic acid export membrane protein